ncbi:MBL fold metallo-hydrolase [Candidatus Aalborgicola defluviihabitans]|uniref:MBL fold metallo-hydrolase n=1 Tax=Candidatus Aalborgicola defluviihabitans TaxID=3386187 RepID=UPI001D498EF3|nr:MBL fold metallo-hydrolase [Burkholderiales bacterium]
MPELTVADRVEVLVLVDNSTDNLSSVPGYVETEFPSFWRRGARLLAGDSLCCAAHGFSCAITVWRDGVSKTLLFDSGPDSAVFERNVDRLGFKIGTVDGMVLSHGHWDHSGAMLKALDMIQIRNGGEAVPTYMHPGMYAPRAMRGPDGAIRRFDDVPTQDELERHGATVIHSKESQVVLDNLFFISGEIPRVTSFEKGRPGQVRRSKDGTNWEPDPLLLDERFIAVNIKNKGLLVFTACSHAGVVNVLKHAHHSFSAHPIHGVVGGFHLAGPTEANIPDTVRELGKFNLTTIAAGHCTGWRAIGALATAFGDAVVPSSVGKIYKF